MNDRTAASGIADGTTIEHGGAVADVVVPVIAETLSVDKQVVDTGRGVRLHKTVRDEVVTVSESVASDDVFVERVAIGRAVEDHPGVRYDGDTMVVPVVAERVVTRVELVLVEEIRVTRRRNTGVTQQDVVLRREEVVVERFDDRIPELPGAFGAKGER